jgi:hypothetical protein
MRVSRLVTHNVSGRVNVKAIFVSIGCLKDPVTQFFSWFYFINLMLKIRFVNIVSSNKQYL